MTSRHDVGGDGSGADRHPELAAIWAQARGGIIGASGSMPWHCPADFAFFKDQTVGFPVIMGRTTWESFPPRFRPLPGRSNIVLSRSVPAGQTREHDGATWVRDLPSALRAGAAAPGGAERLWILGGASVYEAALAAADLPVVAAGRVTRAVVTELDIDVVGDTRAPVLGPEWSARELGVGVDDRGRVAMKSAAGSGEPGPGNHADAPGTGTAGTLVPVPIPYRFMEYRR